MLDYTNDQKFRKKLSSLYNLIEDAGFNEIMATKWSTTFIWLFKKEKAKLYSWVQ